MMNGWKKMGKLSTNDLRNIINDFDMEEELEEHYYPCHGVHIDFKNKELIFSLDKKDILKFKVDNVSLSKQVLNDMLNLFKKNNLSQLKKLVMKSC